MDSTALAKNISLTDPSARWTAAPGGPAFYAYSTNYLIDLHTGIIVDVEATPAHRTKEVNSATRDFDNPAINENNPGPNLRRFDPLPDPYRDGVAGFSELGCAVCPPEELPEELPEVPPEALLPLAP
jgi:hypothetical protein